MMSEQRYIASITACSGLPTTGSLSRDDPADGNAMDAASLHAYADALAAPWHRLAQVLECLGPRGWVFTGIEVEPGGLWGDLRKRGTSNELYEDVASLPEMLLAWVNDGGVFVAPVGIAQVRAPSFEVRCTPNGWALRRIP